MNVFLVNSMCHGEFEGCVAVCKTRPLAEAWIDKNKHKYVSLHIEEKPLIGGEIW